MSEELKPVAWLLTGSKVFVDSAHTGEESAERTRERRGGKDTATIVPLYAATALQQERIKALEEALSRSTEMLEECAAEFGASPLTGIGMQIAANIKLLEQK